MMPAKRVLIRLKHSLQAGEEINTVLPDTLDEFEQAFREGRLREELDRREATAAEGIKTPAPRAKVEK